MIVTCPGCTSKYRVSNDAVPAEGSRMRCPKCETLFLAKPPAGPNTTGDDALALQQLVPAPMASVPSTQPDPGAEWGAPRPVPRAATPGFPRPGVPGVPTNPPATGPITALFAAFDPTKLPPEMQRPQPPSAQSPLPSSPQSFPSGPSSGPSSGPTGAPGASGLEIATAPKVRVASASSFGPPSTSPTPASRTAGRAPAGGRRVDRAGAAVVAASWLGVLVALFAAVGGVMFFAWTTEAADLDAAWMPRFERALGVEPPYSRSGRDVAAIDELRRAAEEATTRGDASAAIVLWSRVKAQQPADPRAAAAIAKLRTELEDHGVEGG